MTVIDITSPEQFKQEVTDFPGIVLADFWAERCGPCRMVIPVIHEIADDYEKNKHVKIVKVNVDKNPALAQQFQITSIPAVFLIKAGEPLELISGANPKEVYQEKIDAMLASSSKMAA